MRVLEVRYKLVHGPTLEILGAAWRWRNGLPEHGDASRSEPGPMTATFTISDGVGRTRRQFVVDGLNWPRNAKPNEVLIEVEFAGHTSGSERWSGPYNFRTHNGEITSERGLQSLLLLDWSTARPAIEMLVQRNILTLAELTLLDEWHTCNLLVEDTHGLGMSNDLVGRALERFDFLRQNLNRCGLRFQGKRHDLNELFQMF